MLDALQILLTVSLLGAVAGAVMGLWPRRIGDHLTCSACGYDLTGLESRRCPECGAMLHGMRAIEIGRRDRRWRLALISIIVAAGAWAGRITLVKHLEEVQGRPYRLAMAIDANDFTEVDRLLKRDRSLVSIGATSLGLPLPQAVKEGDAKIVKRLIDAGADVKVSAGPRWPLLHEAAEKRNADVVDVLLRARADFTNVDGLERTALHVAACHDATVVQRLLAEGSVDPRDGQGHTPLHLATLYSSRRAEPQTLAIVSALLHAKADVNAQNHIGQTPLHFAMWRGSERMLKLLLQHGADPVATDRKGLRPGECAGNAMGFLLWRCVADMYADRGDMDGFVSLVRREPAITLYRAGNRGDNLLHHAARIGQPGLVAALLDAGMSANVKNNVLSAPLHCTTDVATARLLLDRGAHVNATDSTQFTPLHSAAAAGNLELVRLLVSRGAQLNVRDRDNANALRHAVLAQRADPAMLEYLVSLGAETDVFSAIALGHDEFSRVTFGDPTMRRLTSPRYGLQPIHVAARYGRTGIVRMLLDHGTSVNVSTTTAAGAKSRVTPLMMAAESGNLETVQLLVSRGANVNLSDAMQSTALHRAVKTNPAIVELLLSRGANADVADSKGNRPLHLAAACGNERAVKLLLDCGARADRRDGDGLTASQLAERAGKRELAELIRGVE